MKIELIDTHAHLYLKEFEKDLEDVLIRAGEKGIKRIFLPNIDTSSIEGLLDICKIHKGTLFPMIGLHPTSVKEDFRNELERIRKYIPAHEFIAIGEIGIDLYWDKTFVRQQEIAFREQLNWGKEQNLPVVIHARDSFDEIFKILDEEKIPDLQGVFHSFTGNKEQVERILSFGFYIGINGIVTFKNSGLAEVVKTIPLEKLLVETDSPFLAPVPFRGKRNESSYVSEVADKISELFGMSVEEISRITTTNALKLFSKASQYE